MWTVEWEQSTSINWIKFQIPWNLFTLTDTLKRSKGIMGEMQITFHCIVRLHDGIHWRRENIKIGILLCIEFNYEDWQHFGNFKKTSMQKEISAVYGECTLNDQMYQKQFSKFYRVAFLLNDALVRGVTVD